MAGSPSLLTSWERSSCSCSGFRYSKSNTHPSIFSLMFGTGSCDRTCNRRQYILTHPSPSLYLNYVQKPGKPCLQLILKEPQNQLHVCTVLRIFQKNVQWSLLARNLVVEYLNNSNKPVSWTLASSLLAASQISTVPSACLQLAELMNRNQQIK